MVTDYALLVLRHAVLAFINTCDIVQIMTLLESNNRHAALAVATLRRAVRASDHSMTQIAEALGMDRHTVSKNLNQPDIPLVKFLAFAEMAGEDPLKILSESISNDNASMRSQDKAVTA